MIICLLVFQSERRIFTNFHRQVFCWTDQWHGLTMQDIRAHEDKTKIELDVVSDCCWCSMYSHVGKKIQ